MQSLHVWFDRLPLSNPMAHGSCGAVRKIEVMGEGRKQLPMVETEAAKLRLIK